MAEDAQGNTAASEGATLIESVSADTAPTPEPAGNPMESVYAEKEAPSAPEAEATEEAPAAEAEAPSEEKAEEGEKTLIESADAPDAPAEPYEAFTMPEGMEADQVLVDAFSPVARELNLSQEGAQKMVDMFSAHIDTQVKQFQADQAAEKKAMRAEIENVPNFKETLLSPAARAMTLAAPADKAVLAAAVGNNPAFIRFMAEVGRRMGEDTMSATTASAPRESKGLQDIYKKP